MLQQGTTAICVNFNTLSEDFYEGLHGFSIFPAVREGKHESSSGWTDKKELWVDKYKPRSLAELAVHKKKIEEVKMWLEERIRTSKDAFRNHALVITGQAGVGKSATIHVIASQLRAELCEWKTPTPTLWQEHIHNANSEMCYTSKLEEFETFVERIRKYALLPSVSIGGSKKSVIVLIDDLPVTNGRAAFGRLSKCLHFLALSAQIPTVILFTDYNKTDSGDSTTRYREELQSSLERAGASKVAFNPLTINSIKKTLSRICREEQFHVPAEQIDQIAKSSGGDIRHAITSLQYFCLRPDLMHSLALSCLTITNSKGKSEKLDALPFSSINNDEGLDEGFSLPFGRDESLSLFHALGKFLHNKRETVHSGSLGQDVFLLRESFARPPLKMDSPEKVLCQAHGQARTVADFLHENVLDFVSDEAIDDAWTVASYLSDADCLLATHGPTWQRMIAGRYELENVAQLVGASVAVRGVLFGNSHPSPPRWHSIRSPKLWQAEQSSWHNENQMALERFQAYNSFGSLGMSAMATEYKPTLKWLGFRAPEGIRTHKKPTQNSKVEECDSDWMGSHEFKGENSGESEGDEIED
ncbi:RADIATION SENSITIVE 17 isoform X2 [Tasmannia lanceolata]|uniref:RADIATION SENSITIVE 17 isoform X2 n=1 Tax=Tasmannia lanceolata TaxID=3420 RepID=UPI0040633820